MMPSISESADPEGAAILLESLAEIDPSLKVDVSSLRQEVEVIKKRLQEFLAMRQRQMDEYKHAQSSEAERIYK
jgi:predicted ATP-grasp superfamily ATP-dependent carboligase